MGCAPSTQRPPGDQANAPAKKIEAAVVPQAQEQSQSQAQAQAQVQVQAQAQAQAPSQAQEKPIVVFVLGGPGSGKGTQCDLIVKEYGFTHFSVGDLLRAEKASGSETAALIEQFITEGKLVPAKIPVELLKKAMQNAGWASNYYLVDGFPRNQENLEAWESVFLDTVEVKFTLYYECSFETMEKRILERAKISGRSDDNPDSLKKRFETYTNETKPVIDTFTAKGLIRTINAERGLDEIFVDTKATLDTIKDLLKKPQAQKEEAKAVVAEVKAEEKPAEVKAEEKPAEVKAEEKPAEVKVEEKPAEVKAEEKAAEQPAQQDSKPSVIFVLGGPGSGKGTQCEKIIADFGLKHLSVGDLLRAEKASGSELAKELDQYMNEGKLVPSEVPVKLLKEAIEGAPKGTNFLIDGFPRNKENIDLWNSMIGDVVTLKHILFFKCSFETMEARILERAKISGRSDDNIDALKKRFETYQNESAPVVEAYQSSGIITHIDAERDIDAIYADTKKTLEGVFQ